MPPLGECAIGAGRLRWRLRRAAPGGTRRADPAIRPPDFVRSTVTSYPLLAWLPHEGRALGALLSSTAAGAAELPSSSHRIRPADARRPRALNSVALGAAAGDTVRSGWGTVGGVGWRRRGGGAGCCDAGCGPEVMYFDLLTERRWAGASLDSGSTVGLGTIRFGGLTTTTPFRALNSSG